MPRTPRHYEVKRFSLKHEHFGNLEVDLKIDNAGIIAILMKRITKTRFFRTKFFGGAIEAELTDHSKIRTKAIRRLRGKG